ncbi:MAG: Diaminopimelate epimerase [Nitrospira sp.]|nr:Diaminopimelate epimerase [Nitrospira sp.]
MKNGFFRGHGLGNDYIVMDPKELSFPLSPSRIKAICDRNWGLGSDGILALAETKKADFGLRIYNPDGSEAEKSGNGLRIFARYLHATGKTKKHHFTVETKGGLVTIELHLDRHGDASSVTVEMGKASFGPASLPCTLTANELITQPIEAAGQLLMFTGVSVGNPHCVVFKPAGQSWSRKDLLTLGPALENHVLFPKRTNVQLAVPIGPKALFILIWERGAGETQASGSSSCAAASAAVKLGLVTSPVTVKMPGGQLNIKVAKDFSLTMKGPVAEVARGGLGCSFVRELR